MSRYTNPVLEAFKRGRRKKITNTESTGEYLYLFGNAIARWNKGIIEISDGGYKHTVTTRDRLNILGAKIILKQEQFYKNDVKWNGKWINIDEEPFIEKEQEKQLFR